MTAAAAAARLKRVLAATEGAWVREQAGTAA